MFLAPWRGAADRGGPLPRALRVALLPCLLFLVPGAHAEVITVAAATNFAEPLAALGELFRRESGHRLVVSSGSSGQLYAQISHGAPYDIFLSADAERPERLEEEGKAVPGTRFTYALGILVLWRPSGSLTDGEAALREDAFLHLALANPRLAPYGLAARQTLEALGLWEPLQPRLVLGENVGQAYSLVATGNAPLGLIALSQIQHPGRQVRGGVWEVPEELHEPVVQDAVLLKDQPAAREFLDFLRSPRARQVIEAHGYSLPRH